MSTMVPYRDFFEEARKASESAKNGAFRKKVADALKKFRDSSMSSRTGEFGIGSAVGGGSGAGVARSKEEDEDEDKKKKATLRGALIGGLLGGAGAVGLNKLMQAMSGGTEKQLNNLQSAMQTRHSNIYDHMRRAGKPDSTLEEEKLYDQLFIKRGVGRDFMKAVRAARNTNKGHSDLFWRRQKEGGPFWSKESRRLIRKGLMRDADKVTREAAENELLKRFADRKSFQNFYDQFIKDRPKKLDSVKDYRGKMFGGARSFYDNIMNAGEIARDLTESDQILRSFQSNLGRSGKPGALHSTHGIGVDPESLRSSKEFRDYLTDIKKNVAKDVRKGKKGDWYERKFNESATSKGSDYVSDSEFAKINELFGTNVRDVKSKKELDKVYKNFARKNHPDINKSPDAIKRMQQANAYMDKLRNTDWHEKLAFFMEGMEKTAEYNEFMDMLDSMSRVERKEFLNDILKEAQASDIVDGLYMEKIAVDEDAKPVKKNEYSPVFPQALASSGKAYGIAMATGLLVPFGLAALNAGTNVFGKGVGKFFKPQTVSNLIRKAKFSDEDLGLIISKIIKQPESKAPEIAEQLRNMPERARDSFIEDMLEHMDQENRVEFGGHAVTRMLQNGGLEFVFGKGAGSVGASAGIARGIKEIKHNIGLMNEDRQKIDEMYGQKKKASNIIEAIYKTAKMTVPSKKEIEKELRRPKSDLETIKCQVCNYKGETTPTGECPSCGAMGGVDKSTAPKLAPDPENRFKGIGLYEADAIGRLEDTW